MYKIKDFSKITEFTVKALHYYDEQGILVPNQRGENGYRLYDEQNYKRAKMIKLLKELGFSILEMKEVFRHCESEEDLLYYLKEKKEMIENNIAKERELIAALENHLTKRKEQEKKMKKYDIEIKEVEAISVASYRYEGKYRDMGEALSVIYKEIKSKAAGAPMNCYWDEGYAENAQIEVCVPVKEAYGAKRTVYKRLASARVLTTKHIGSYDTLGYAYKALLDYAADHGLKCTIPSREIYVKGPGMIFRGNPERYETILMIPIES